jgi:hypothetical protein
MDNHNNIHSLEMKFQSRIDAEVKIEPKDARGISQNPYQTDFATCTFRDSWNATRGQLDSQSANLAP